MQYNIFHSGAFVTYYAVCGEDSVITDLIGDGLCDVVDQEVGV
jgi:hypothetical protein